MKPLIDWLKWTAPDWVAQSLPQSPVTGSRVVTGGHPGRAQSTKYPNYSKWGVFCVSVCKVQSRLFFHRKSAAFTSSIKTCFCIYCSSIAAQSCYTYMHCEIGRVLWASTDFCKGQGQTFLNAFTEVAEPHVYMTGNKLQHCTDCEQGKKAKQVKRSTWWRCCWAETWVDEKRQPVKEELTCVNLMFTVWRHPAGSHRHEATPRSLQSADDGYGCVHNRTGHHPKYELWWRVHHLQTKSEENMWANDLQASYTVNCYDSFVPVLYVPGAQLTCWTLLLVCLSLGIWHSQWWLQKGNLGEK